MMTGCTTNKIDNQKIKNEKNIIPRIIYTMPFLSIVDQNEEVLRKILNYSNYDTSDISSLSRPPEHEGKRLIYNICLN